MAQSIYSQLVTALCALAGGLVFGLSYDALKAVRLSAKNNFCTALCDILACIIGVFLLFYLAMAPGRGEIRIYICVCALIGTIIYFALISRVFLGIFLRAMSLIAKTAVLLFKPFVFLSKMFVLALNFFKKFFQKFRLWYKMKVDIRRKRAKESSESPQLGRDFTDEIQKSRTCHKNRHSRDNSLRGDKPSLPEGSGFGRSGDARRTAGTGGRRSSDQHRAPIRNRSQHGSRHN
ncbi:MAG: hypothetical protein EOM51_01330 [Clostridia bacterium]|nr:hypothetical protein [Clostridia bacterium]